MPSLAERLQQYLAGLKINPQDPNSQDYNPDFESGVSSGIRDITNYTNQLDLSNRQNEVGYQQQLSDLGRQRETSLDNLGNRLSGQGILHSGINIGEQGKIGENYQRNAAGAATGLANAQQNNEMGFNNSLGSFGDALKILQGRHSQYVSERQSQRARETAEKEAASNRVQEEAANLARSQLPLLTPTGQFSPVAAVPDDYRSPGPGEGAQRFTFEDENVPFWQKIGFGSEEEYLRTLNPGSGRVRLNPVSGRVRYTG